MNRHPILVFDFSAFGVQFSFSQLTFKDYRVLSSHTRNGQFVKDLPAVKCKYLILPAKKCSLKTQLLYVEYRTYGKARLTKVSGKGK